MSPLRGCESVQHTTLVELTHSRGENCVGVAVFSKIAFARQNSRGVCDHSVITPQGPFWPILGCCEVWVAQEWGVTPI